jgi:ElaB/YqjD/DUF883 family membrane-anchored ribosome-binding protein
MNTETTIPGEKLKQDVKSLVSDLDEIVRATASQTGEKFAALREKAQITMHHAREHLADAKEIVVDKTRIAARATDDYVHENPWHAVGIAAGVGLVIGMLIGRR